ncbi:unnamed protein product [Rhizoctonia solani]|uniref:Uncharacterized protein n=1 Tax=Rhizoctonia solani TaxID=456999 RepID=A0A8H3B7N8_9AGAM|nr:unnamed protein product [Rhizoctonia solani]
MSYITKEVIKFVKDGVQPSITKNSKDTGDASIGRSVIGIMAIPELTKNNGGFELASITDRMHAKRLKKGPYSGLGMNIRRRTIELRLINTSLTPPVSRRHKEFDYPEALEGGKSGYKRLGKSKATELTSELGAKLIEVADGCDDRMISDVAPEEPGEWIQIQLRSSLKDPEQESPTFWWFKRYFEQFEDRKGEFPLSLGYTVISDDKDKNERNYQPKLGKEKVYAFKLSD